MDECTILHEDASVLEVHETFFTIDPGNISTEEESECESSDDLHNSASVVDSTVDEGEHEPLLWVSKKINMGSRYKYQRIEAYVIVGLWPSNVIYCLQIPLPGKEALDYEASMSADPVAEFKNKICCKQKCVDKFSSDELQQYRDECAEIDFYDEAGNRLDLVIVGLLRAFTRTNDLITHSGSLHKKPRQRKTIVYQLRGEPVCEAVFLFAYNIGMKRWKRLKKSFAVNGVHMKSHGNRTQTPRHSLTVDTRARVITFIRNYAEEVALFLPGRVAQHRSIVKLLPSDETKVNVFAKYEKACKNSNVPSVSISSFRRVWSIFCPDIVIQRPRTDLCAKCQAAYVSHAQLRGKSEEEKTAFFDACRIHLETVHEERQNYFAAIRATRNMLEPQMSEVLERAKTKEHCIYAGVLHYSFDFAQQIHVPMLPQQPGPIFFLTPFKIGIFGVMNDTLNHQGNYLIPESVVTSKGANAVISYLHDFLERDSCGETEMQLHADNCCAQNKNHFMIYYLMFRVLHGFNHKITLSFLPVGHTKFSCDWAFGLLKKRLRSEEVHDMADVCEIVQKSTPQSEVNIPIATGAENGDVYVDVHDWSAYFARKKWKRIPQITQYCHFTIDNRFPGSIRCQKSLRDPGINLQIFPVKPGTRFLLRSWPRKIRPAGISRERAKYLKEKIVPYVRSDSKLATVFG